MNLTKKVLWQIENHLRMPISLEDLAALCAVSKYHMVRSFRTSTGHAPMTYLRARRLTEAAEALAKGDTDLLSIALEFQYQSHEAFTRAFSQYFGVLPNSIRRAKSTETLVFMEKITMDQNLIVDLDLPKITKLGAFTVKGVGVNTSVDDTSNIPVLWQELNQHLSPEEWAKVPATFGVCVDFDEAGKFRYVAGFDPFGPIEAPDSFESTTVPANTYAVFTHRGHISDIGKSTYTLWNKTLPESGHTAISAPSFERYDQQFNAVTGFGDVEIWVPIENPNA